MVFMEIGRKTWVYAKWWDNDRRQFKRPSWQFVSVDGCALRSTRREESRTDRKWFHCSGTAQKKKWNEKLGTRNEKKATQPQEDNVFTRILILNLFISILKQSSPTKQSTINNLYLNIVFIQMKFICSLPSDFYCHFVHVWWWIISCFRSISFFRVLLHFALFSF